ncbi:type IV toxin-antitoxin system AbiEi family antitoxin domain-containing protein [Rhodococcus sp. (in: high G+C Gram-positive bacteria)]|uniref:type IV toxin-antitoxin system AbiEi family antitoxin domain-containing protein n=1 Tax=Rhodococcus sp. TaxID=1831 RepID=UPI003B8A6420
MSEPIPTVLRRRDALARGYTDGELRATCRSGGLRRLRPGTYLSGDAFAALDAAELHHELVRATIPGVSADAVVSHQSAAVLHGLPVWALPLDRVHVTRHRSSGGKRTRHLHSHSAPLTAADVVLCDGISVTSVARTVADLCRTVPFDVAVVVGDAALRAAKLPVTAVADALVYAERRPGYPAARRALGFLDGRSESVGESRSRVALAALGFEPELQASLLDPDGRFLGRVDFLLADAGVVGEFDGKIKYGKYLRDGQDPGDAVFAEKQREDSIRDMGWEVARWTWRDLSTPAVIDARIGRALLRRGRPRPVGTALLPN